MSASDPFSFSNVTPFQVPEQMRAFAEQGVAQAQEGYLKLKEAAESNNGAMGAVYASASRNAGDFTAKVIDIAKTNTESAFHFAQSLLGVTSVPEAFELVNSHARRQFELLTAQSNDLAALGQKVAADAVEPMAASTAKVFKTGV